MLSSVEVNAPALRTDRLRVCSPHCGVAPESGSGGEVYERELLRALGARGVETHVLLARHQRVPDPASVKHWTMHRLPIGRGLRWPVAPFVFPRAIRRCWRGCGPFDLLRAHSVRVTGPAALWARRRYQLDVPVIVHHHHVDPSWLARTVDRRVIDAADAVVTDSAFARAQLREALGVRVDHVRVVHCGVAPAYRPRPQDPDVARRYGLETQRVVLCVGPLIARKRPFEALDVLREVSEAMRPEPVTLLWVGDGPLRARVERYARAQGLPAVFVGHVSDAEKLRLLALANVFVFLSVLEGFPLAPLEAMACGVPVVAFRAASMAEMIEHGASGLLAPPLDLGGAARHVVDLLRHPVLRARLGERAAQRVDRRFRWHHTARGVHEVYRDTVRSWRRPRRRGVDGAAGPGVGSRQGAGEGRA